MQINVTFVQMSLSIITSLLTSGTYLLTNVSLISAATIIIFVRNHAFERADKKDIVYMILYILFLCYINWEFELRRKKDFI